MLRETQEFKRGRNGERLVASILQSRGWFVVPSYDYSGQGESKAPKMHGKHSGLVLPDLDVCKAGHRRWVEVKTKRSADLHRKTQRYEHGISRRLYDHYLRVEEESGSAVWLVVYEESTGRLITARLAHLRQQSRFYDGPKMGRDGMVFFPVDAFEPFHHVTPVAEAAE